jgi:hypothetical protein
MKNLNDPPRITHAHLRSASTNALPRTPVKTYNQKTTTKKQCTAALETLEQCTLQNCTKITFKLLTDVTLNNYNVWLPTFRKIAVLSFLGRSSKRRLKSQNISILNQPLREHQIFHYIESLL